MSLSSNTPDVFIELKLRASSEEVARTLTTNISHLMTSIVARISSTNCTRRTELMAVAQMVNSLSVVSYAHSTRLPTDRYGHAKFR